ncbi:hypothetical protein QC762_502410 [Podospora pseudocomata]|uniref:C2H2-type domain-containing protein n=1 Tax=Podospora pseudocomata TaxID=2093779 RepID=A0ABR0G9V1_9PEZI|nr:hypothetical protein QC762_502410 [Podospora pseudocomata]
MAAIPIQAPSSRHGPRDTMNSGPLPSLSGRDGGFPPGPFAPMSHRIPFNDNLSPSAASNPMAIRNRDTDFAPPPLPPPRLVPINGPIDPKEHQKWEGMRKRDTNYDGSVDSGLGMSPHDFRRRDSDYDETYHSYGSNRSTTLPSFSAISQTMKSFRPSHEAIDNSMLNRLNRPTIRRSGLSTSHNELPPPRAHHADLSTLSLPHRSKQPFLDIGYSRSPMSATSPGPSPFGHPGPMDYRSPLSAADSTDLERSPRSHRLHSTQSMTDSEGPGLSHGGHDYEGRDEDVDFPMEETTRMRRLKIEDPWRERERERESYQPGQKRRASSPPSDDVPMASDSMRWPGRDGSGISRGSPTPRLLSMPQNSTLGGRSPVSRSGSYSSNLTTSSMTLGRRSPGLSPSGLSPTDPMNCGSPYGTPLSMTAGSPRSAIGMGLGRSAAAAAQQPTGRIALVPPRKVAEMPKNTNGGSLAAKLKGPYMCECCPKKPKKFETEEELRTHEAEKQYECTFCGNRFKNKNEAERHQNSLHVRRHSWSCSALTGYERAFHDSTATPGEADTCGYCGKEFGRNGPNASVTDEDWEKRIRHLQDVHKFRECNASKKFYRADHFRQHLKHSHAGTSGKWTNMLENACMIEEDGVSVGR